MVRFKSKAKRLARAKRKAKTLRLERWNGVPHVRSKHVAEGAR